jgi:hypothetical protein
MSLRSVFQVKWLLIVVVMSLAFSGTAMGANSFKAQPWSYDPDQTGCGFGEWVTGEGLPDAGNSNHALLVSKKCSTSTNAAGGATIEGVEGILLPELGFSYRNGGSCSAGAPRFNVYTEDDYYFFGCIYGAHTPNPADVNWTDVRFSEDDGFRASNGARDFSFETMVVQAIEIIFDEGPGSIYLDNITINGMVIGRPGNA